MKLFPHGMMLGKFMPLHNGHLRVLHTALRECEQLTVLVCSLPNEPIPGILRYRWVVECLGKFPNVHIVHVTDIVPQRPEDDPYFWAIWCDLIVRHTGFTPDVVYAGEDYGQPLGDALKAIFRRVDRLDGECVISGTDVRNNALANWDLIPKPVQDYYLKKVAIVGPESTGKSTLVRGLSLAFGTRAYVPEFGRFYTEGRDMDKGFQPYDFCRIAEQQRLTEFERSLQARGILFCDTDVLTTAVFSELYLDGGVPINVHEWATKDSYDLTLLLDIDLPWVNDGSRDHTIDRKLHFKRLMEWLGRTGRPYELISGVGHKRLQRAVTAVEAAFGWPAEQTRIP